VKYSPHVSGVRQALRDATSDSHHRVDTLFSGYRLDSQSDYGAFLTAHARALGALESVARPASPRLSLIAADLAAMDMAMPAPLFLADPERDGYRWGLLYALEGSRLGGAMLARQVAPGLPRAYLSAVHGKGGWVEFQHALDRAASDGGEGWLDDAVQGAQAAFALFAAASQPEPVAAHG
jgi:heme oxygenase